MTIENGNKNRKLLFSLIPLIALILLFSNIQNSNATSYIDNGYTGNYTISLKGNVIATKLTGVSNSSQLQSVGVFVPTINGTRTNTDNGNTHSGYMGDVFVTKITHLAVGTPTYVLIDVSHVAGHVRAKIYLDNGVGTPTTLLGQSNSIQINATGWNYIPLASTGYIPTSGILWVGFETDDDAFATKVLLPGTEFFVAHAYGSGPDPLGGAIDNTLAPHVGVVYTPLNHAGQIRVKAYSDTAGVPDTLLAQSNSFNVTNGWNDLPLTTAPSVPSNGIVYMAFEVNNDTTAIETKNTSVDVWGVAHVFNTGPSPFGAAVHTTVTGPHMRLGLFGPSLSITPNSGPIGRLVVVNGTLFGSTVNTDISINGHLKDTIGHIGKNFTDTIRMHYAGIMTGIQIINATDQTGSPKLSAIASFNVTTPTIFLNSSNGNVAKTVSVKGKNFINDTFYYIQFDNTIQPTIPPVGIMTNSTGGFSGTTFVIPDAISGTHTVKVQDGYNNNGTLTYNVTSSLSIVPSSSAVGTPLTGNAKGFLGSHNINIKFDGISKQNGTSNTVGTFSGISFNVPSGISGNHVISATDSSHTATFTFNIPSGTASITLNATNGKVGKNILISGDGFNKSSQLKFYFNNGIIGTTPALVTTNSTGSFTNTIFTIPNLPLGYYVVKVNDTVGNFATNAFTINALSSGPIGAVSDLHIIAHNTTSITLAWSQPNLAGNILSGYQINYTTPAGTPLLELTNNTLSSSTSAIITPLFANTQYSFRLGVWAGNYFNSNGNIVTGLTSSDFVPQNFTVGRNQGSILNASNPSQVPMYFIRNDIGNSNNTILNVIYPNSYHPTCSTFFEFAGTNKSYSNLANSPWDGNNRVSIFNFNNINNDIVDISCYDPNSKTLAKYVLTEPIIGNGKLIFLQQIDNFRNGIYGTHGQFGALDFITLVAVLLSMIGLNRYDEAVGGAFSVIIIGMLSFFGIISILSTILSVVALVVLLLVTTTRKN